MSTAATRPGHGELVYRVLSGNLEAFQQAFASHAGLTIPIEYFHGSVVTGAFDGHGVMAGGYVTAPGTMGRWLSQIPDVPRYCPHIVVERSFELNGVWLARRYQGRHTSAQFWRALARDVASRDVAHVIFAVDVRKRGLARLYESMAAGVMYEGPILNSTVPAVRYFHSTPRRFAEIEIHYAERLLARSHAGHAAAD